MSDPPRECFENKVVYLVEGYGGLDVAMIIGPAKHLRVELSYHILRISSKVEFDGFHKFGSDTYHCLLCRSDMHCIAELTNVLT